MDTIIIISSEDEDKEIGGRKNKADETFTLEADNRQIRMRDGVAEELIGENSGRQRQRRKRKLDGTVRKQKGSCRQPKEEETLIWTTDDSMEEYRVQETSRKGKRVEYMDSNSERNLEEKVEGRSEVNLKDERKLEEERNLENERKIKSEVSELENREKSETTCIYTDMQIREGIYITDKKEAKMDDTLDGILNNEYWNWEIRNDGENMESERRVIDLISYSMDKEAIEEEEEGGRMVLSGGSVEVLREEEDIVAMRTAEWLNDPKNQNELQEEDVGANFGSGK